MAASTSGHAASQNYFQLYRNASVGMALTDALDELIESGHISPQLARKVVEEVGFSVTINEEWAAECTAIVRQGRIANIFN